MFQFPAFASGYHRMTESLPPGCPIRTSAALWVFAPRHGFSQLVTSFFASESQGILHAPFLVVVCCFRSWSCYCLPWASASSKEGVCAFDFVRSLFFNSVRFRN